jgi:hypothetical protein
MYVSIIGLTEKFHELPAIQLNHSLNLGKYFSEKFGYNIAFATIGYQLGTKVFKNESPITKNTIGFGISCALLGTNWIGNQV